MSLSTGTPCIGPVGKEPRFAVLLVATRLGGEVGCGLSTRAMVVLTLEEVLQESDISDCKRSGKDVMSTNDDVPPAVYSGFLKGIVNVPNVP
jgi:hypothetical protein